MLSLLQQVRRERGGGRTSPLQLQELFVYFDKTNASHQRTELSASPPEGADLGEASPFRGVSVQALPSSSVSYLNHAGVFKKTPGSKRRA